MTKNPEFVGGLLNKYAISSWKRVVVESNT